MFFAYLVFIFKQNLASSVGALHQHSVKLGSFTPFPSKIPLTRAKT
jgi:hypothetical protein